jgi:hypothetical protein
VRSDSDLCTLITNGVIEVCDARNRQHGHDAVKGILPSTDDRCPQSPRDREAARAARSTTIRPQAPCGFSRIRYRLVVTNLTSTGAPTETG